MSIYHFGQFYFLKNQKETGLTRKLVAFEMVDRGIPRHDYPILDASGAVIGKVTSKNTNYYEPI